MAEPALSREQNLEAIRAVMASLNRSTTTDLDTPSERETELAQLQARLEIANLTISTLRTELANERATRFELTTLLAELGDDNE